MATVTIDLDEFIQLIDPIADQDPPAGGAHPGTERIKIDKYDLTRIRRLRDLCRKAKVDGESWVNVKGNQVTTGPASKDRTPVGL